MISRGHGKVSRSTGKIFKPRLPARLCRVIAPEAPSLTVLPDFAQQGGKELAYGKCKAGGASIRAVSLRTPRGSHVNAGQEEEIAADLQLPAHLWAKGAEAVEVVLDKAIAGP